MWEYVCRICDKYAASYEDEGEVAIVRVSKKRSVGWNHSMGCLFNEIALLFTELLIIMTLSEPRCEFPVISMTCFL